MDRTLDDLRAMVTHADVSAPSVSQWNVGMHVHHCGLAMMNIGRGLAKSTSPVPPERRSVPRLIVFTLGRIPRGRARNSAASAPTPSIPPEELLSLLDQSAKAVEAAKNLGRDAWITHPIFGPLRRDDALKFVRIHNRHHLKIVSDILTRQA
jgi:hypothetical protein